MNGLMLAVYWIGAYLIDAADAVDKLTTFSNMVVFSSYSIQAIMSFLLLSMVFVLWPRADVSAQRVLEVIDTEPMVADGTQDAGKPGEEGEIEFRNVSFAYPDSRHAMLEGVNFKANAISDCGYSSVVSQFTDNAEAMFRLPHSLAMRSGRAHV